MSLYFLQIKAGVTEALGPFIRGKIRRELDHLYEHVLSKTRTARINGSRLISVLDSFHVNVVRSNGNPTWRAKN